MLNPLTLAFSIIGSGFESLRRIQQSYNRLRDSFRIGGNQTNRIFGRMSAAALRFFGTIRNGTVRVGNAFKIMAARSEDFLSRVNKSGTGLYGTLTRIAAVFGGGMLFKKAFDSAANLELIRTAIASMRGQKRADELMGYGIKFANVTPYETQEVLEGMQKLELRGLTPEKYMTGIGNMAAALGKPLDQAIEAMLDAMTGEFERMKEFGITKKMIEKISPTSFDKKGSLINQKKMFDDLMNYIDKTYKGGMENLSKTISGTISTIKGTFSSLLSMLVAGSQTGKIVEGSPLYILNEEVLQPLAKNMQKWQEDGTFTKWSQSFAEGVREFYSILKSTFEFVKEYKDILLALLAAFIAFKVLVSVATGVVALANAFALLSNPIGLTIAAIAAIIAIWIVLYKKVEWFRKLVDTIYELIKSDIAILMNFFDLVTQGVQKFIDWVGKGIDKVMDFWGKVKSAFSGAANMMKLPEGNFRTSFEYDMQGNFIGDAGVITNNKTNEIKTINEKPTNITIHVDGTNQGVVEEAIEKAMYKRDLREGK